MCFLELSRLKRGVPNEVIFYIYFFNLVTQLFGEIMMFYYFICILNKKVELEF